MGKLFEFGPKFSSSALSESTLIAGRELDAQV